jgi:DNA-directed RNA polymerase specialized sigma24 family protein
MAKTRYDYAKQYLDDAAEIAKAAKILGRMLEDDEEGSFHGSTLKERKEEYDQILRDVEDTIAKMDSVEGYALICRYVYLWKDAKIQRKTGYSRSGIYKLMARGINELYDYLPDDWRRPYAS